MKDSLEMAFKIYFLLVVRGCSWNIFRRFVDVLGFQVENRFFLFIGVDLDDWILVFSV